MILHHLETLLHTFTDCNGRNNYNKLVPSILLVQFEHCLYIDISFSCSGLHLHIKRASTHMFGKYRRFFDVIVILDFPDIL